MNGPDSYVDVLSRRLIVALCVMSAALISSAPCSAQSEEGENKQPPDVKGEAELALPDDAVRPPQRMPDDPVGDGINYQGWLRDVNGPVTGSVDLRFRLYDDAAGGVQIGPALELLGAALVDGRFSVELDFGSGAFTSEARWLEIDVFDSGAGSYVTLAPRQSISAAPVAHFALAGNEGPQGPIGPAGAQGPAGDSHWRMNGSKTYYNAGNVGIGTNSPRSLLELKSVDIDAIYAYSSNKIGVYGSGATNGVYGSGLQAGVRGWSSADVGVMGRGPNCGGYFEDSNEGGWCQAGVGIWKTWGSGAVSFVQNHPEQKDRVIVYACPEGDEVATYTRGTARLVDGEVRVKLGETFKWVTNPDVGLTAHLTARGECRGLYVASLTTEEMAVRETGGGRSDVVVDFLVYGLRIGFEELSVVQEKTIESKIPSMAQFPKRYEQYPELRRFNALERFTAMCRANGMAQPLDLRAARDLHDAIEEFDPALHMADLDGTADIEGMRLERDRLAVRPATVPEAIAARPAPRGTPNEIVRSKDAEIIALQTHNSDLESRLAQLESLVAQLAAQQGDNR